MSGKISIEELNDDLKSKLNRSNNKASEIILEDVEELFVSTNVEGALKENKTNISAHATRLKNVENTSEENKTNILLQGKDIENLKQSVSSGKNLIANAITDKGIVTLATDTFQKMADNIINLSSEGVGDILINTFIQTERPSNPGIGDIWVYTDIKLNNPIFSLVQPENPLENDLWINFNNLETVLDTFNISNNIINFPNPLKIDLARMTVFKDEPTGYKFCEGDIYKFYVKFATSMYYKNGQWNWAECYVYTGTEWILINSDKLIYYSSDQSNGSIKSNIYRYEKDIGYINKTTQAKYTYPGFINLTCDLHGCLYAFDSASKQWIKFDKELNQIKTYTMASGVMCLDHKDNCYIVSSSSNTCYVKKYSLLTGELIGSYSENFTDFTSQPVIYYDFINDRILVSAKRTVTITDYYDCVVLDSTLTKIKLMDYKLMADGKGGYIGTTHKEVCSFDKDFNLIKTLGVYYKGEITSSHNGDGVVYQISYSSSESRSYLETFNLNTGDRKQTSFSNYYSFDLKYGGDGLMYLENVYSSSSNPSTIRAYDPLTGSTVFTMTFKNDSGYGTQDFTISVNDIGSMPHKFGKRIGINL